MIRQAPPGLQPPDDDTTELAARVAELEAELAQLHAGEASARKAVLAPLVEERERLHAEVATLEARHERVRQAQAAFANLGTGVEIVAAFAALPLVFLLFLAPKLGAGAALVYALAAGIGWWRGSR